MSSHTPTLQIYIIIHNQFSIDPNQFTHQHFRSISSSTINLQILTKKKQIKGNKVPNDCDSDEAQSELLRGRGTKAEMSVREWAATMTRERGRDERVIETLREWGRNLGWAATVWWWWGKEAKKRVRIEEEAESDWERVSKWGRGWEWFLREG